MLEVHGQPGELPLMEELAILKKNKGLRDLSGNGVSSSSLSQKTQVLDALASFSAHQFDPSSLQDISSAMANEDHNMISNTNGCRGAVNMLSSGSSTTSSKKESMIRSPQQLDNVDARRSWDLGKDSFFSIDMDTNSGGAGADDFRRQRDDLKNQLEKLGILGNSNNGASKHSNGTKSLLHNWMPANAASEDDDDNDDDEEDNDRFNVGEDADFMDGKSFEQEAMICQEMQNWLDANRDRVNTHQSFMAYKNDQNRSSFGKRSSSVARQGSANKNNNSSIPRMHPKHERLISRENAQILSPLALNSHDDLRKFSHSKTFFSLDAPYDEEEQYYEEAEGDAHRNGDTRAYDVQSMRCSGSGNFVSSIPRRLNRKPAMANASSNHQHGHMFPSAHQRAMPAQIWEAGNPNPKYKSAQKPPKYHRSSAAAQGPDMQECAAYMLPQKTTSASGARRYKVGSAQAYVHQPATYRKSSLSGCYSERIDSGNVDTLHLQTELEDYSGSEDSSVDEDDQNLKIQREPVPARRKSTELEKENKLQLAAVPECKELALCDYKPRNLSQKYRPKAFDEVVGQNIVTQALSNAVIKGKIAPVYLFQGSRGTGKTTAARIFAAALICTSTDGQRPCSNCRECIGVANGKCSEVKEVDAASNNGIERVKTLLEETISAPTLSRYKVFIIDECHVLTTETWNALLKILEEPPVNVVFILITTDPDRLPRTAVSRCQKFPFPKIKETEIVKRLQELAGRENLEVDADTLQLIASRSDGSLRDAETTLDQLSLLGQQINASTVYELVGSASDDRMLSLLDSALRADTVTTVRKARELVDSGVEPLSLMSRLATLITDILAGTFKFTDKHRKGFFRNQTLTEEKLEWLRMAMKTLSEAEKQLRNSNDRATWLTAALLQLGPDRSSTFLASCTGTSVTQSPVALDDIGDTEAADYECTSSGRQTCDEEQHPCPNELTNISTQKHDAQLRCQTSQKQKHGEAGTSSIDGASNSRQVLSSGTRLEEIWHSVVERCWPLPLRQSLHAHGKLISIAVTEVGAVVRLEVDDPDQKSRCERSQKSIANVFEAVLGCPAEMHISLGSLPPEEELLDAQKWMSRDHEYQYPMQESVAQRPAFMSEELQPGRVIAQPYSMSYGLRTHQSGSLEAFPAIPQVGNQQHLDPNTSFCWSDSHNNSEGGRDGPCRRPRLQEGVNVYVHKVEGHDIEASYSDEDKDVDGLETQSLESNEGGAFIKTRPRHSSMEGPFDVQFYSADGRRSCDAEHAPKKKGSGLKMVRGLTMRSRIQSNPNSPDRRGISRKNKPEVFVPGDGCEIGDGNLPLDASNYHHINVGPKKNKFKEAAGSVARFFKGGK